MLPAALCCAVLASLVLSGPFDGRTSSGAAAALTPPAPPTFVPTPIGPPPGPPTRTVAPVVTPTSGTGTPGTVAPTHVGVQFSLDAARVSKVGNPGNLSGLAATKPGNKVWLMMYYTVHVLSQAMERKTVYTISYKGKTIYRVSYRSSMKPGEVGRFSRYTVYAVPATLPYGSYLYTAILSIGHRSQTKRWKFALARRERSAATGSG